jgi:hypothetical protein
MNIIRTALAAAFAFALTAGASAATYSANGAGASGNSSTIGPGGDYPTLAAAAADFNSVVGGMAGNYTFFITGDITETTTAAFGSADERVPPDLQTSPLDDAHHHLC